MAPLIAHGFARTPVTALDSELSGWHPVDLAVVVVRESLNRAQVTADRIDEVIVGCAEPVGAQGADVARAVVLSAGWPAAIGGLVVERGETSGMTAIQVAADAIRSGRCTRVVVVGLGMGSVVSPGAAGLNRTYGPPWGDGVAERMAEHGGLVPVPRLAEAAVRRAGLDRGALDTWAERSSDRRKTAPRPRSVVSVASRPGEATPLVRRGDPISDDRLRDLGSLAELPPAFDTDGITTAGTFAPPADAVAALVLESAPVPGMEIIGSGRAAGEPSDPTGGVGVAVDRTCRAAGVDLGDVELIEAVETSAATAILVGRSLGLSDDTINRRGGALATGDSGAAEELRLVCDAVDHLTDGRLLLTVSAGPTGSAAMLWQRRGEDRATARP